MPDLTENELRAVAYYSIGVSSEGGDVAYQLSFAGQTIHEKDGSVMLKPVANSGYSIGTLQTDFGAQPKNALGLVDSFQDWAKTNHPDWALNDQQHTQFASDLGRNGHHIRDPNYDHDLKAKAHIPESGQDIDQNFKSHLNSYLATDAGKTFIHQNDTAQVKDLMDNVAENLKKADFYKKAAPEEQAKIFAVTAKVFNQSQNWGRDILQDISHHKINSLDDISKKIDTFPDGKDHYMRTGRDAALRGAEAFNTLRNASERNPIHESWQAVVANPLVNPTQVGHDPKQPHLADQYSTVKGSFVDPAEGKKFVDALEAGTSHNYGDPASSRSRGFYVEGKDFVQWDKNGQGRAFVDGQWSEFSRNELALAHNKDHTLDINLTRNGATHSLLHVVHPSGHGQAATHHAHEAGTLPQGMHREQVQKLQTQLGELGYLDNITAPDGKFGPVTTAAVKSFQHDHHLPEVGQAGPATQHAMQADLQPLKRDDPGLLPAVSAMSSLPAGAPGLDDPRNALNPDHELYSKLSTRIPDASEQRLLQFVAACHQNQITGQNLGALRIDEETGLAHFGAKGLEVRTATVDIKIPSPQPTQSIQQIQQYDQHQVQINTQVNAQIQTQNAHAPPGPVLGVLPTPGGPPGH